MSHLDRRSFIAASAASIPALSVITRPASASTLRRAAGPIAISSGNGSRAVERAAAMMTEGADAVDAVVAGVRLVEEDPDDMSVGYGGLPNEEGVVELDASVMHGPTHNAGAVAALRNIMSPATVALEVLRRTDHVLLVGEGALKFARAMGHEEVNLLTDRARRAWVRWKANLNPDDDWLDRDQQIDGPGRDRRRGAMADEQGPIPFTWGTIHCAGIDAAGNVSACTTTSGLSYKIPGRVGDSPIVGAGMFVDNEVGAAGATGRGESLIQSCGAFQVVQHMANGAEPEEACLRVLKWIADHTRRPALLNERGEPNFQATIYALRKDGTYGSACMRRGGSYVVDAGNGAERIVSPPLFE